MVSRATWVVFEPWRVAGADLVTDREKHHAAVSTGARFEALDASDPAPQPEDLPGR
jgi:hypothetical protein